MSFLRGAYSSFLHGMGLMSTSSDYILLTASGESSDRSAIVVPDTVEDMRPALELTSSS